MRIVFTLALLPLIFSCQTEAGNEAFDAVQYVDPQIGSVHGRWFFYTPASVPFGMVKLAPHTNAYESMGSWLKAESFEFSLLLFTKPLNPWA